MSVTVLIVGAGISGLSCGYHLNALAKDSGITLNLKIVDARDDVGGRLQNVRDEFGRADFITKAGLDLDMGGQDLFFGDIDDRAALLTDEDQDKFRAFLEDFPPVRYANSCESAINNEGNDCEASKNNFDEPSTCTSDKIDNYCVCVGGTPPDSDDEIDGIVCDRTESSLTAIANTRGGDCRDWCAQYIAGDSFTKCTRLDDPSSCNQDGLFPRDNRNASFADASLGTFVKEFLYEPIKDSVTVDTEIVRINFRGNKETYGKFVWAVKADGKRLKADHLVVAVPKTVLKDESKLKFVPRLNSRIRNKFAQSDVAVGVRIWVEFDTKFYDTVTDFPSERDIRYWDALKNYDTDKNIVTLQGNRKARRDGKFLVDMTETELRDMVIKDLDTAYNNAASANFDYQANKFYVRNYEDEKFINEATHTSDIDFSDIGFGVEGGRSIGLVDGRIWFIGDYLDDFPDNPTLQVGKLAAEKIWEKVIRDRA